MRKFKNFNFSTKVLIVYICSLLFALSAVTYAQIITSAGVLEEESTQNLNMLTEQVALNFSENQSALSRYIYSRMVALEIPALMDSYAAKQDSSIVTELRYALVQMVTEGTEYDYVLLEMLDGTQIDTGGKIGYDPVAISDIRANSRALLEEHDTITYGNSNWYRGEDGDVYILRDVYTTLPLRRAGRAILHMRNGLFSVSERYENTAFLFFDRNGAYLSNSGMVLSDELLCRVQEDVSKGILEKKDGGLEQDYYMVTKTKNGWITVGVSSTAVYRQMVRRIIERGIALGLVGLCLGVAILSILIRVLTRKMNELKKAMTRVAEGDFSQHIAVTGNDDISQLAETMNYMTNRIHELLQQLVEKERLKNEAEIQNLEYKYRSLETQIRPHFIYNALETINAMAKIKGNHEIVEIVQRISRYFRGITINTTRQFITCQQEFDMLRDYTEIYRFIHGENLHVTFSAREEAQGALIPTMILQPVVENALQHGIRSQDTTSEIIVHAYVKGDCLTITVKDTGYGLSPQAEQMLQSGEVNASSRGGIGIGNVRQRLHLIYGEKAFFTINNREEGGVVVKIIIPLTYIEEEFFRTDDLNWDS